MSVFGKLFRARDKPTNQLNGSAYSFFFGGTAAGQYVNERSAMQMSAVYACVRILSEAIAALPDVQRTVFQLRYYDDMKYSDISKLLQTSEGALKASYHIAVKKITEFFRSRD
jgi:DNA-directed RNA polymerase specialized sigma24 family protein